MRRIGSLALAALITLTAISPASAVEPGVPPSPAAEPTADPTAEPTPAPTAEPTADRTAGPTLNPEPSTDPSPEATPDPTPDPTPAPSAVADPSAGPGGPSDAPTAEPSASAAESAAPPAPPAPSVEGEYIVVLRSTTDASAEVDRQRRSNGIRATRTFERAVRGYAAKLDREQLEALESDPDVVAVVPDDTFRIQAQTTPTGVSRVGAKSSTVAKINGVDERVDADVAIVDTGIQPNHPDLNVVGGYNCSTTTRSAWRDVEGHGTHVAGTVGALDNATGVVGVAPGARLWAVKILDDTGWGKLSWYVCGLDWILAQRDPNDSGRPLFEAVNMSVTKARTVADDGNCGRTTIDVLHQAICRVVAGGIPVAVAAGNYSASTTHYIPAMYSEVMTISALADTDGKSGGLGGNLCYSWGTYDSDDTFANFSNYGKGVDLMAPGKCIWSTKRNSSYGYSSGTSMATPAVTGAIALYKASRPTATPAEVKEALQYLGNVGWKTSTDPDSTHEKLLDVSRLGPLGSFSLGVVSAGHVGEQGGSGQATIAINRSATFFERVRLSLSGVPAGWSAALNTTSVLGWTAKSALVNVTVPAGTDPGTYQLRVTGTNQGRTKTVDVPVVVGSDKPVAAPPTARLDSGSTLGSTVRAIVSWPAATDASSAITGYQWQWRRNGGSWSSSTSTSASKRTAGKLLTPGSSYDFRVRAKDAAGNWSAWAMNAKPYTAFVINDRSASVVYRGSWSNGSNSNATSGTLKHSRATGATATLTFSGRGIAVVAPMTSSRGWLEVRVDGRLLSTVSLQRSTTAHRRVVWATTWATSGTRTIELRVVRTSSRPLSSLDAFVVLK